MTSSKLLTSRLAAHIGTAHIEVIDYLDHQAEKAASIVDHFIVELMKLVPDHQQPIYAYQLENEVRKLCDKLPNAVGKSIYDSLMEAGDKSANAVVAALVKSIPLQYMPIELITQESVGGAILKAVIKKFKRKEPAVQLTKDEVKRRFKNLLLEPIEASVLEKIVLGGAAVISRLMTWVKTTLNPRKLADLLIRGISDGKNRREIARDLQQELGATKAQAKRIARTEGARVATQSNMAAYEQLGDMVVAYAVHAVLDERTRPQHRIRNGWIYYKEPKEGDRSVADMPHPPIEPDGSIAWNCRCFLSPVFQDLENLDKQKYIGAATKLIPDPLVYQDFWKTATERQKRIAVGSRRYDTVVKKYGANANYFHFIDENGDLLPLEDIALELPADAAARVMRLRTLMGQARKERRDVLLFGSA